MVERLDSGLDREEWSDLYVGLKTGIWESWWISEGLKNPVETVLSNSKFRWFSFSGLCWAISREGISTVLQLFPQQGIFRVETVFLQQHERWTSPLFLKQSSFPSKTKVKIEMIRSRVVNLIRISKKPIWILICFGS